MRLKLMVLEALLFHGLVGKVVSLSQGGPFGAYIRYGLGTNDIIYKVFWFFVDVHTPFRSHSNSRLQQKSTERFPRQCGSFYFSLRLILVSLSLEFFILFPTAFPQYFCLLVFRGFKILAKMFCQLWEVLFSLRATLAANNCCGIGLSISLPIRSWLATYAISLQSERSP